MSHVMCPVSCVLCHVPCVICHMSCVMFTCCILHVTSHLSMTPSATFTDPPSANSPIMHSRLIWKDLNTPKQSQIQEIIKTIKTTTKNIQRYANNRDTLFDRKSPVQREARFPLWHTQTDGLTTDRHCNLETELAQWADTVKKKVVGILSQCYQQGKFSKDLTNYVLPV